MERKEREKERESGRKAQELLKRLSSKKSIVDRGWVSQGVYVPTHSSVK